MHKLNLENKKMVTNQDFCLPAWNSSRAVHRFKLSLVLCILELTDVQVITINTQGLTTIMLAYFEIYIGV